MRSSKDNSALASQMTNSKWHFRSRTHVFEQINLNAVCRENICRNLSKQTAVTTVMTNNYRNIFFACKTFVQIVRQSLSSCANSVNVHTIWTYTHDATQAACTEFKIFIKSFYQFSFIRIFQHTFHFSLSFCIIRRSQPFLSFVRTQFNQFFVFHDFIIFIVIDVFLISISETKIKDSF